MRFALPVSDLNFWDVRRSRFTVEQGSVEIQVGGSSRDIRLHGEVQIGGEVLAPRNGLEVIRAENYDDYSGVLLAQATHTSDGAQVLSSVDDGDWVAYHEVGFGAASALDRVNVRRLLIEIRRQVRDIANTILFEPNRDVTLAKFSAAVTPRLQRIQALAGLERFKVVIDSSTTSQQDIENNTIRGKIFVQPTKSIEYVSLDFVVTNNLSQQ